MADSPDLAALARRYVDLWQDQLTAMAADPALAESTARLLAALVPAGWPTQPPDQDDDAGIFTTGRGSPGRSKPGRASAPSSSPSGAAPAGAAFDERDRRIAQLTRRVGALEKRLSALEAGIRAPGRDAEPRPRKRKK
jgi:hypothetical protein